MKFFKALLALSMIFTSLTVVDTHAATTSNEYELYPTPHSITYLKKDSTLSSNINVVYESGIDKDTKNRLKEVFKQKNITVSESSGSVSDKTNVFVGIHGSDGFVDRYVKDNLELKNQDLFNKTDGNLVHVEDQTITVLGKDTDAAFYGLTTLYHVVNQMEGMDIHNFHMEDYADIVSRGFIEGYYGNPWSTDDRINLMKWGGYYKLNSYFYAPKDDPKHNKNWRELYSQEEIDEKIKPLAQAGNESKCRFVYALHPYMNNPIATDTNSAQYAQDLKIMQAKFKQVIDAGVRQIAILADDAGNKGGPHYIKMLQDMVAWLKEVQKEVPDLKITLPFCTQEYMHWGENYYSQFPQEVQIVMTGGKVWGEVNSNFTNSFEQKVGRGPYLWINWPCTDNSKKHLIMAGYSDFLQTGVDANKIEGIVLNPMQQSEPSKVAIFGNACYSWNMWESNEEADRAWFNSFDYVDHNSAKDTAAASALRELSKHMINQNMDSRVRVLQESVELKKKLDPIKNKLNKDALTVNDIPALDDLINEFKLLQNAAKTYRSEAGNTTTRDQIVYWLNCWDDTTVAAIKYLNAIKAFLNGDSDALLNESFAGADAFEKSKTHNFHYVDHDEYAEVGVQHIVPFIKAMDKYTSSQLASVLDPQYKGEKYITNRVDDFTAGDVKEVFDGNDSTGIAYQNPTYNMIKKGQYFGVQYKNAIDINSIRILQGSGKNHYEHCQLEYTLDGKQWQAIPLVNMDNQFTAKQGSPLLIEVGSQNLPDNFKAMGIRCVATQDNRLDAWLEVKEIAINKVADNNIEYNVIKHQNMSIHEGNESKLHDGDDSSIVWYKPQGKAGDYVGYDFGKVLSLKSVHAVIGVGDADKYKEYTIETSIDGQTYRAVPGFENGYAGPDSGKDVHDIELGGRAVRYIRIRNLKDKPNWIKIGELSVENTNVQYDLIKSNSWSVAGGNENNLNDGHDQSWVWYDTGDSDTYQVGDYIGYNFGKVIPLESAHIIVGQVDPNKADKKGDKFRNYCIETSIDGKTWEAVEGYKEYEGNANEADVLDIQLKNRMAQYIRVRALDSKKSWIFFSEFTVVEGVGDAQAVITNTNENLTAVATAGSVKMNPNEVTLDKGQYIGLRLPHIYDMKLDHYKQLKALGFKIEATKNNQEWVELDEKGGQFNQVRVVSTKDQLTFNAELVSVTYDYVAEISVDYQGANKDQGRDMRTAKNAKNVFDGNLSTFASIADVQQKDKPVTFDLGQVRDFNSIRYYVNETSKDFLRHAKFEVSVDGKDNWQEVLVVGKEQPDTSNEQVAKDQKYLIHDSNNPGNMYAEKTGLNAKGRYLRVIILTNYSHRWMDFGEIQINGGEYVSPNYAYDVVSDTVEVPHYYPLNAIDGDFTTSFKPTLKDGKATIHYHIKDADAKNKQIRIVQKGEISNALVQVRYANEDQFVGIGLLSQAINDLPFDKTVVEVKIIADGIAPEILEMLMLEDASTSVHKNYLAHLIKVSESYKESDYTKDSWAQYQEVLAKAKKVYESNDATQEQVNNMVVELTNAQEQLVRIDPVVVVGKEALSELINKASKLQENDYTSTSWSVLTQALARAKEVYGNKDATMQQVQSAVDVLTLAMNDLVLRENPDKSALEKLVQSASHLKEKDYTKASWALFNEAYINATKVLANKDATLKEVEDAKGLLEAAISGLKVVNQSTANKSQLQALVNKALAYKKSLYTTQSYNDLQAAIRFAQSVLENKDASAKQVAIATSKLQSAIDNLVLIKKPTPATGDQTNVGLYVGIGVVAIIAIAVVIFAKKKEK